MRSPLISDNRRWLVVTCAICFVFGVGCYADSSTSLLSARVVVESPSTGVRKRYLQNNYYNGNGNGNGNSYYNNNGNNNGNYYNGYNGNGGNGKNWFSFLDGSSSGSSGSSSNKGSSNYQFGSRVDNDEFFHWLEILGVIVGVALAITAVSFLIYCLLYPFILCCSCVQGEADAFHTIDTYDVKSTKYKHGLASRPSDSYSMA